jgi:hypothetical protein
MAFLATQHMTAGSEAERLRAATHVGMPHWAGTSPTGGTCGDCVFFKFSPKTRVVGKCQKKLPGVQRPTTVDAWPASTPACKYLERRDDNRPTDNDRF